MSDSNPNIPTDDAELYDRLIDSALGEALGGQHPPDLSQRILAAAGSHDVAPVHRADPPAAPTEHSMSSRMKWAGFVLAASVLIAAGFIVTRVNDDVHASRRVQDASGRKEVRELSEPHEYAEAETHLLESREASPADAPAKPVSNDYLRQPLGDDVAEVSDGLETSAEPLAEDAAAAVPAMQPAAPMTPAPVPAAAAPARGSSMYSYGAYGPRGGGGLGGGIAGGLGGGLSPADAKKLAYGDRFDAETSLGLNGTINEGLGIGAGEGGDQYAKIVDNPFKAISQATTDNRLSTFSIDVDTASYANVRQFLNSGAMPPPDAVRIEEMVNYFDYDYSAPTDDTPFAANVEIASCPWNGEHRLARIGIKGREMDRKARPKSNLVFLIDVSGSMDEPDKLPLLVEGMRMLTAELGENDRVAIAVYASTVGLVLESTPGTQQDAILDVLDKLQGGGSTAGGAGIQLAYKVAADNFIKGGVNRVILCTDGDFNVGVTSTAELERLAEAKAKETGVFLTVLGFGRGNLNDEMMEKIADKGNGNYHYVDGRAEAKKVLVEEMTGTLVTIAKDVKIQVEFNPAKVAGYRLIGYENRVLAAEDFNDDKKDAGEIGAGHTVTALYEVVPAGKKVDAAPVDGLKYAAPRSDETADADSEDAADEVSDDMLTLKIRYKAPDGDKSTKLEFPVSDNGEKFAKASDDFKFASAVASFGMLLRNSPHKGDATYAGVKEIAESAQGRDAHGYRKEFVELVAKARELAGEAAQ